MNTENRKKIILMILNVLKKNKETLNIQDLHFYFMKMNINE